MSENYFDVFRNGFKNRFVNDYSIDIDYSVKSIWNTTAKLLQEKYHGEYKLTFNSLCEVPNLIPSLLTVYLIIKLYFCLNCSFGNLSR
jgi:hypothetical protein